MSSTLLRIAAAAAMQGARRSKSSLDLGVVGTFGRTGAKMACDGSQASLLEYASGARCYEDRGDGAGSLLCFEDGYRQWIQRSSIQGSGTTPTAPWTFTSWNMGSPAIAAPDGVVEAYPNNTVSTSTACRAVQALSGSGAAIADSTRVCISAYVKDAAADIFCFRVINKAGTTIDSGNKTSAADWARYYNGVTAGVGVGNITAGLLNGNSTAQRFWDGMWGVQFDVGEYFPHRLARTAGAAVADVGADSLTLSAGEGAMLFDGSWRIPEVSLDGSDTERNTANVFDLWSVDGNNRLSLEWDTTVWRVRAYQGGVLRAESVPVAWLSYGLIGTVDVRPADGVIAIEGIDGPVGTAWTWAAGISRFGGRVGGGNELRGRMSDTITRVT